MGRDDGHRIDALAGQVNRLVGAFEEHKQREDELVRKIDRLLETDRDLAQRVTRVETSIQDATQIATAFGQRTADAAREREKRLAAVERADERQAGQRNQFLTGSSMSVKVFATIIALAGLVWAIISRNNTGG